MDSAIPRSMSPRAHPSRHGEPDVSRSSASRGKPMRSHTLPNVASLYSTLARTLPLPDSSLVLFDHDLRYLVAGGDDGAVPGPAPPGCEGKAIREVLPPAVPHAPAPPYRRARDADERVRTRGESETAEEHVVVEGRRRTLLLTRSPLRDYDGRIIGVLSSTRDVTEQRQMEDRLSRAHRMESVARLAGGIAHDFNNLLTVVLGSAEILLDDLPRAYARRNDLEEIKTAATQAAQLTRQVLAYTRQPVLAPRLLDLT